MKTQAEPPTVQTAPSECPGLATSVGVGQGVRATAHTLGCPARHDGASLGRTVYSQLLEGKAVPQKHGASWESQRRFQELKLLPFGTTGLLTVH